MIQIELEKDVESRNDVLMMAIEDDERICNSIYFLMKKSDDEKDPNELTIFDILDDLDTLLVQNMRKLVALLIDSADDRNNENINVKQKI